MNTFKLQFGLFSSLPLDLPKAQVQSDWTEAFPGETVSLQCVIPGSETWTYMWFKGSETIVSSDETGIKEDNTLTLSVKSSHGGEYTCQAELKDRMVKTAKSKTHSLTVHGKFCHIKICCQFS